MTEHTCQGKVFSDYRSYLCGKKAGHEHEGHWFCKTHHPPTIEEKQAAKSAKWDAKMAREKTAREHKAEMERKAAMYDELLAALNWISTVNAMDYEYQAIARAAISKATGEPK